MEHGLNTMRQRLAPQITDRALMQQYLEAEVLDVDSAIKPIAGTIAQHGYCSPIAIARHLLSLPLWMGSRHCSRPLELGVSA